MERVVRRDTYKSILGMEYTMGGQRKKSGKSNSALKRKAVRRSERKAAMSCATCENLADVPNFSFEGRFYGAVRLAKIFDGDTITIVAAAGKDRELCKLKCRISGIDAGSDAENGKLARRELVSRLQCEVDPEDKYNEKFFSEHVSTVDVLCGKFDRYGRVLVDVAPVGGEYVNKTIVSSEEYVHL
jgi:endonuclease YncB( thermonuclease family)